MYVRTAVRTHNSLITRTESSMRSICMCTRSTVQVFVRYKYKYSVSLTVQVLYVILSVCTVQVCKVGPHRYKYGVRRTRYVRTGTSTRTVLVPYSTGTCTLQVVLSTGTGMC